MWTIEEYFEVSNEEARRFILICDIIRELLLILNYILLVVYTDVKDFYIQYYQILSQDQVNFREAIFAAVIYIELILSLAAIVSSVLLNIKGLLNKKWPITVWMVVHGIATISITLICLGSSVYLLLEFSLISPPIFLLLSACSMSSSFHMWSCWLTLVYYSLEDNFERHQMRNIDVPWVVNSGNGLSSQNNLAHWRNVQLETAKLLELGCVLPATNLPHFQMYRWAFVGTEFDDETILTNGHLDDMNPLTGQGYVPHVRRIARLMDMKYAVHSPKTEYKRGNHLVLTCQQISSLQDLYGFFSTLSVTWPTPHNFADTEKDVTSCLAEIESVLSSDFLEKLQTSTTPR